MEQAHQRRGVARQKLGKYLQSTMDFEQALRLEPKSKMIVHERNSSKTAYELEAEIRPTQARRVVKIGVKNASSSPTIIAVPSSSYAMESPVITSTSSEEAAASNSEEQNESKFRAEEIGSAVQPSVASSSSLPVTSASGLTVPLPTAVIDSAGSRVTSKPYPVPRNGAEFERVWKRLNNEHDGHLELIRALSPDMVSSIFRTGITAHILTGVIRLCLEGYISNTLSTSTGILNEITKTPRFDMAVMFITGTERKELQGIWDVAAGSREIGTREDLVMLRKKYKL